MRKLMSVALLLGLCSLFSTVAHAVPLDVPYGALISSTTVVTAGVPISFSTGTLSSYNQNLYGWCVDHLVIASASAGTFTMYYSTSSLASGTTTYSAPVPTTGFRDVWPYRTPFCIPANDILNMQFTVTGATVTYEGYSFKGWSQ